MRLEQGEEVCSLIVVDGDGDILTASERGYGKRTPEADYPRKGRGTKGVIALQTTARNGTLVGAIQLSDRHEVLLISDRSEERRVGKECVDTGRSRLSPDLKKKKTT